MIFIAKTKITLNMPPGGKPSDKEDALVEKALLDKATGFYYDDEEVCTEKQILYENGKKISESAVPEIKKIRRYKPGDLNAQMFWLINRVPERWRDKKETRAEPETVTVTDGVYLEDGKERVYEFPLRGDEI